MKNLILWGMLVCAAGCGPSCLKGHYVEVNVQARFEYDTLQVGEVTVYIPRYIPGHKEQRWVCDQYQVENP